MSEGPASPDQVEVSKTLPFKVGTKEGLKTFLLSPGLESEPIGLNRVFTKPAIETMRKVAAGATEVPSEELAVLATSIVILKEVAQASADMGFAVSHEAYSLSRAIDNSFAVLEQYGGVFLSPSEKQKLADVTMLIPLRGTLKGPQTTYGKLLSDYHANVIGIVIADRDNDESGAYHLEGRTVVAVPTDKTWERKITHELLHAVKMARVPRARFYSNYGSLSSEEDASGKSDFDINEGLAALMEYVSSFPLDKREEEFQRLMSVDLGQDNSETQLFIANFGNQSTLRSTPMALDLVAVARITGVGLPGLVNAYLNSGTRAEMGSILLQAKSLSEAETAEVKAKLFLP